MAIAYTYEKLSKVLWSGGLDWTTDDVKVALVGSGYTPDMFADEFWDTPEADEISGTGYTAGGQSIAGAVITDNDDGTVVIDCDDPVWTTTTLSGIRFAVFYKDTGTPSTSPLLLYVDFETDLSTSGIDFSIAIPASGVVNSYTSTP